MRPLFIGSEVDAFSVERANGPRAMGFARRARITIGCPPHSSVGRPRPRTSMEYGRGMTEYEATYILRPSLEESEVDQRVNAIAEIVKSQGGEVSGVERLGKKRLAYEINDAREGNYVVMQFKSEAAVSKELERQLKLQEDVLRALIVRLDAKMLTHMASLAAAAPPAPQSQP